MSSSGRERPEHTAFDVLAVLAPARRQLGLRRVASWAVRGLLAGGIVALFVLGAAHLHRFSAALVIAAGALVAGLLVGLAIGIRRWPDRLQTARTVDHHFNLHDRLTTALELRASALPLAELQRSDAGRRLAGLKPRESARGQFSRRESGAAAVVLMVLVGLALVGLPAARGAVQTSYADQQRVQHAAQTGIPRIVRKVNLGLGPVTRHDVAMRNLNLALQHLRRQLQHASNRAGALRAISATQQQLHRIAASLHPIRPAAVSQLNRALASRMSAQQRAEAAGNSQRALKAAASTLQRLARELAHMSAAQRAALARSLARAASTTSDSTMRSSLQQAASSLGYQDPKTAASALQEAAAALDRSPSAHAAQSAVNSAAAGLESMKGGVSGLSTQAGSSTSSGTATTSQTPGSGRGQVSGQGKGNGSGQGQGKGTGSGRGQGKGSGSGQGQGRGTGTGSGQGAGRGQSSGNGRGSSGSGGAGGTGGHGIGGGRGGSGGQGSGHLGTRVYIPGKFGKGTHTIQNGGPNGAPLRGSTVPYRQVIGQYAQTAHTALDRASLPPSMQTYVRQYFSSISH
ncbi:MAG: hypothetical protein M3Z66_02340 [Chloroflexota bacterium]|nr:hypothetical protein [Chloroflexota bacterium]